MIHPSPKEIDETAQAAREAAWAVFCANAGDWDIPMAYDGGHFTEQGHRAFASGLLEVLK